MTTQDLMESFVIDPQKHIEPHLTLVKKLDINAGEVRGCFKCGDMINTREAPSVAWSAVRYCSRCNHISVIWWADKSGGPNLDSVEIYTDKPAAL